MRLNAFGLALHSTAGDDQGTDGVRALKHTPGPWIVERGNVGDLHPLFVKIPGTRKTGEPVRKDPLLPWNDADAYLIAASPDLLEALKGLIVHLPPYSENELIALKAIDKAEGRV